MQQTPLFPKGMNRRWWLYRPISWLTALCRSRKPKHGLLVIRMDGLGDMLLFRPILDYYAEAFAVEQHDITVLGCHSWKSLAGIIFAGYKVITIDEHAYDRNVWYRLKISLWLSRQCFKIAVCDMYFRKPMVPDCLLYYSYADEIVVCEPHPSKKNKPRFDYFRHIYTRVIDTGEHPRHEALRHYTFISSLLRREITPKPFAIQWHHGERVITAKEYVVVNFGSNSAGRRWPFESFVDIAKRCVDLGYTVVFLGGPAETHYRSRLAAQLNHPKVLDYIGKTKDLGQVFDLFQYATATITSETGPGYFSLALQVPTLMMCGGGSNILFTPLPKSMQHPNMHFLIQQMPCFGCKWHCPYRKDDQAAFPCIANITVDNAWQIFEKMLPLTPNSNTPQPSTIT